MRHSNETVAEALEALSELAAKLHDKEKVEKCDIRDVWSVVRQVKNRIEVAHRREIDSLNFKLMTAKSEQKTAANVIIEQTNKVDKLEREVAELRECLARRSSYLNAILQKALELCEDVPVGLRKVMDECIVAEDKAIGLGVFSLREGAKDEGK